MRNDSKKIEFRISRTYSDGPNLYSKEMKVVGNATKDRMGNRAWELKAEEKNGEIHAVFPYQLSGVYRLVSEVDYLVVNPKDLTWGVDGDLRQAMMNAKVYEDNEYISVYEGVRGTIEVDGFGVAYGLMLKPVQHRNVREAMIEVEKFMEQVDKIDDEIRETWPDAESVQYNILDGSFRESLFGLEDLVPEEKSPILAQIRKIEGVESAEQDEECDSFIRITMKG